MASIVDVARAAKVSTSTVSMVVHHRDRVSPDTRKRVEEAIARLGYVGRGTRRKPAPPKALRLAMVYTPVTMVNGAESIYCRQIMGGLELSLRDSSSTLHVFRGAEHVDRDAVFLDQLHDRRFDGLVFLGVTPADGYLDRAMTSGVPVVAFNRLPTLGQFSTVTLDYFGGVGAAIRKLASLGHQRIGVLGGDPRSSWPTEVLHAGTLQAFSDMKLDRQWFVAADMDRVTVDNAWYCQQALDLVQRGATAIHLPDAFALPVIAALTAAGRNIPRDVSVMGFDHRRLVTPTGLALSSVRYSRKRMGYRAGQIIRQLTRQRRRYRWMAACVRAGIFTGQTIAPPPSPA
jgi:LacI family transcriptional regulator